MGPTSARDVLALAILGTLVAGRPARIVPELSPRGALIRRRRPAEVPVQPVVVTAALAPGEAASVARTASISIPTRKPWRKVIENPFSLLFGHIGSVSSPPEILESYFGTAQTSVPPYAETGF